MAAGPLKPERDEAAPFPEVPGYRIESVLGRGSTGVVYRAVQLAVERVVALKVLHRSLSRGRIVRRLQREARTTARLSHPNIVAAIDMGQAGDLWWYAMEFVDGPSLAAHLRQQGRLSEREALRFFIPLCEALDHLYQLGVVHRDIKPGNILVEAGGNARLVDLGLAFAEDDPSMTSQGGTLGTPHYVSPEQARNPKAADVRSDIWSLGASFYHAVCGRPPFAGTSVADILSAVLYARIPDPGEFEPSLSKGLRLVLRKCLTRDPAGRYQTPSELLSDLERLRERRQVTVRRRALDPVEGHEVRMRRVWTGAALGAIVLAVIALAVWRPWSFVAQSRSEPSVAEYQELEDLAGELRRGQRANASILAELQELRPVVPEEFLPRWDEVRREAKRRYDAEVEQLVAVVKQELNHHHSRRELAQAEVLLGGIEARVRELEPSRPQLERILDTIQLDTRRIELETEIGAALQSVERRLREYYEARVFTRVDRNLERNQWRGAREVLLVDVRVRQTEASIDTTGLPAERVDDLLEQIRKTVVLPRVEELEADWRRFDESLGHWVNVRADGLEQRLFDRSLLGAARELRREWDAHLERIGLEPDEMLELSALASAALERRVGDLRELEAEYEVEDADLLYREKRGELEPLWAARDYVGLVREWTRIADRHYFEPEREAIDLQLLEARLLSELLERAGEGVRALGAGEEEVLLFVGSIGVQGTIDGGEDPLGAGFLLRPTRASNAERVLLLSLRELEGAELVLPGDVEALAGFPISGPPEAPRDRLLRGLFRWREGDLDAAAEVFPLGALEDPALEALASDLEQRIGSSSSERDLDQRERLAQATTLIDLINRIQLAPVSHARDIEDTVAKIDRVLREFGDLDYVRVRRRELQFIKQNLTAEHAPVSEADFGSSFGAREVELAKASRAVRMDYVFDAAAHGGPWDTGNWIVSDEGLGWQAPHASSREQLFEAARWPKLVLRTPMDLERRLSVELELAQLQDQGPPRLLLVSVAGVHVGFLGDEFGRDGRWLITTGGLERVRELVDALFGGEEGQEFSGLERGGTHRIRIELTQGRGRAEVYLDDVMLDALHQPRPGDELGTASVVVRSIEVLRLLSARIEGSYTSR